jgi:hypothetical protein
MPGKYILNSTIFSFQIPSNWREVTHCTQVDPSAQGTRYVLFRCFSSDACSALRVGTETESISNIQVSALPCLTVWSRVQRRIDAERPQRRFGRFLERRHLLHLERVRVLFELPPKLACVLFSCLLRRFGSVIGTVRVTTSRAKHGAHTSPDHS